MKVEFTLDGESMVWEAGPGESLLEVLEREGYYGNRSLCRTGECGACAVILDGETVRSCQEMADTLDGKDLRLVEG